MAEICGANLDQSSSRIMRDFKNIVDLGVVCPISKLVRLDQDDRRARETSFRGGDRVAWAFTFAAAAYNLVRLPKLIAEAG